MRGEGSNTVAASLAATWVEAFNLRLEAAEEMHDASLAVADGAYAENSAIADAAALGLTAPHVSRSHAAHGWIGGEDGLMGMGAEVDSMGFCPDERLSAEASRALELIRQAGPPASAVRIYPAEPSAVTLG